MKKILITSGGTREYIDEVRVLTNISTGKLGATIADELQFKGGLDKDGFPNFQIHFVYVKDSVKPHDGFRWISSGSQLYEVTDVQSVYEVMEKLVPEMDVVIHPMAVSDFGFKHTDVKLKSNDPEAFIESLKERIYQTPKILSHIKKWNPRCYLISFKFENGLSNGDLLKIAYESLEKNNSDLVIANDKAQMKRFGSHIAYFVEKINGEMNYHLVNGKDKISIEIFNKIKNI